jgi:benzoyl-CoA reductase/2-hydroxyglutaryl-CoA dehydratase subunit BcrC/BadD/HgdB
MNENTIPLRPLESAPLLKSLMGQYYRDLEKASAAGTPKIAWCTSQGPVELLRAMGFLVYFPENHGALLGARRMAGDFFGLANSAGYSPDICSYLTSDIGASLAGRSPLASAYGVSGPPRPDVLVYNNNQCRDVQEWFEFYSRAYEVPVFGIRTPRGLAHVSRDAIRAVSMQMKNLANDLSPIAGRPLDPGEMGKAVDLSRAASLGWKRVLETAAKRPSPITFFDVCIHMGPAVALRGTHAATEYYERLLEELDERVRLGRGAVSEEEFRIYWEGMPIWGKLRFLAETLSGMGISAVASTYGHSWVFDALDPEDPFDSTARAYTELFTVRHEGFKEAFIMNMLSKFQVDAVIFHNSRTCPNCTNSQYGMPRRLTEKTGIPHLVLDGDLNDLRCFSQEQTLTNLEAFKEMLAQ